MSQEPSNLSASGWTLAIAASASASASSESADFHAIYSGEDFDRSGRGIVAVIARGIGSERAAVEAAQIVVHSLVEGYFGAAATLGAARAASLALGSINVWMFGQSRVAPERATMAAALTALVFVGTHVKIIHVGDCRVYRKRGDQLIPLTTEHTRSLPDGSTMLTRAIGSDAEVHTDYIEDVSELSDRYMMLSHGSYSGISNTLLTELLKAELPAEAVAKNVVDAARTHDASGAGATAVVIDVLKLPLATFDEMAAAFSRLPLRRSPRDGENWDGFILGRTLYRSRYTTLRLAHDTVSDTDVVLKIPFPSMLQDQVFRAGFLREAWVGVTVDSPGVARYIDVPPERRSSLYLVMPFYRGDTLEARLSRPPPMPYLQGVGIGLKLCAAVRDLAALQVIHRDLKPENVMLLPDGEVKLLDLGLAFLPGIDEPDDDRLGGTTRYMAPELFRGMAADECSEVFSLGVTLYRMFTGAFPFGQRESVPLARLRPDLPAWLGLCLMRAMEMDRDKRFRNAGELASALEDGLFRDSASPPPRRGWRHRLNALRLWQGLALLFGLGFFILLAILLSGRRI
jgi:serine/threonine protein phosphatase PrpC